jgi:GNAT superfamily N-acetyltransferase
MAKRAGTMTLRIRPADLHEGEQLREIAVSSKCHWGYDPTWVREWAAMGDFSPEGLTTKSVYVGEAGRSVAFAALIPEGEVCVLDDLWVEAEWIGKGIGSELFKFCAEKALEFGAQRMEWEAEPNAIGFYERMGGRRVRVSERTMWGRVIPVMGIDLGVPRSGKP